MTEEEYEALVKIARVLAEKPDGPERMRRLIDAQVKLLNLVSVKEHLSWFWRIALKAGLMAGVVSSIFGAWQLFSGK